MRIGIDTGGTFTDFVVIRNDKSVATFKLRSNPKDPAGVILAGIEQVIGARSAVIIHGSTVATNALLERKGARTAFVTTAGFEDIFHIGRQNRRELYNLTPRAPVPLVATEHCFGVEERMLFDGTPLLAPDPKKLGRLKARLKRANIDSIAICLLHSYQSPLHEQAVADALAGAGYLSVSHQVSPEFREYERSSTTVLNAYVGPLMQRYLHHLAARTTRHKVSILQSNGGAIRADEAEQMPVRTLLSGPAGGAIGASWIGRRSGFRQVLGFDMGGTSTDVCLIDGAPRETTEATVDGFPVQIPMLDIHTVGAGGGSIARVDDGGLLRVGPESAGADPGPACYGAGDLCTVTDAHVFLGRITSHQLAGGSLPIDPGRSTAVVERLSKSLGLSPVQTAAGVIRIANANMERAVRAVSVERGYDPRRFALLAFGGGGGLHACEIAANLEIATVLVPELAGALSALGMLVADRVRDYSRGALGLSQLEPAFRLLEKAARAENRGAVLRRSADLRYAGQSYEINVPWLDTGAGYSKTTQAFHAAHHKLYGYLDAARPIEIVTIRLRAVTKTNPPELHFRPSKKTLTSDRRKIFVSGRWRQVEVASRDSFGKTARKGPLLITDYGSTTLVPDHWTARLDRAGTLVISLS
jgi:N-methylhydantoinase A/oxoprolinase/acetone carboxylase beta subunit